MVQPVRPSPQTYTVTVTGDSATGAVVRGHRTNFRTLNDYSQVCVGGLVGAVVRLMVSVLQYQALLVDLLARLVWVQALTHDCTHCSQCLRCVCVCPYCVLFTVLALRSLRVCMSGLGAVLRVCMSALRAAHSACAACVCMSALRAVHSACAACVYVCRLHRARRCPSLRAQKECGTTYYAFQVRAPWACHESFAATFARHTQRRVPSLDCGARHCGNAMFFPVDH